MVLIRPWILVIILLGVNVHVSTATAVFTSNCAGCDGLIDQSAYPGDRVQYICSVDNTAGMAWSVSSSSTQVSFGSSDNAGTVLDIDDTYFIILTDRPNGGFTSTFSFVATDDQDGITITCHDNVDSTTDNAQFSLIGEPPRIENISAVYPPNSNTTVIVTWDPPPSVYEIIKYNITINGVPDPIQVTEPSITLMNVAVNSTLSLSVFAIDKLDQMGTPSDPLDLNYVRDRPPPPMVTVQLSGNKLCVDCNEQSSISHYLFDISINSSSQPIPRSDSCSTCLTVACHDSVSVSVAAVDEAGRVGVYSDPVLYGVTFTFVVRRSVGNIDDDLAQVTVLIIPNCIVNGTTSEFSVVASIGTDIVYNIKSAELYHTFDVSRLDDDQDLSITVIFNDENTILVFEVIASRPGPNIYFILFIICLVLAILFAIAAIIAFVCYLKKNQKVSSDQNTQAFPQGTHEMDSKNV